MEYWTLRRHLTEVREAVGRHPMLVRMVDLAPRGFGLILRIAPDNTSLCCGLFDEGDGQGIFLSDSWQENLHESALTRRMNQVCRDARICSIDIVGRDRVARFELQTRDPFFKQITRYSLVGEFTGRIGNLLLLDADGIVLEQSRITTNNHPKASYVTPAAVSGAIDPINADDVTLTKILTAPASSWSDRLLGISPVFKRELVQRIANSCASDKASFQPSSIDIFRCLLEEAGDYNSPVFLYLDNGKMAALAAFRLTHLEEKGEVHEFMRVNDALTWLDTHVRRPGRLDAMRERARGGYARELKKREAIAGDQRQRIHEFEDAERLKHLGELIQVNLHEIAPRTPEITVHDWATDMDVVITLDPIRTANQNAQRYFHQYKKAKRGLSEAIRRLKEVSEDIAWLKEQIWYCETAENETSLESLIIRPGAKKQARSLSGNIAGKRKGGNAANGAVRDARKAKILPPLLEIDGCRYYVGRNGRQNDLVTFGVGRRGDLWAHANDVPGAHVVARRPGNTPTTEDEHRAAVLAAWFSFARGSGKVPVDVTDIANVKRIPGGGPGRVNYTHQHTVFVDPREALEWFPDGQPPEQQRSDCKK
ncbi:MAG: NFACT family protein [Candidatus Riflebacteria bacterium]|nr:NFACT family protein [Candidatus Riflebacteria bacterium]